jgi:hypothetical protein
MFQHINTPVFNTSAFEAFEAEMAKKVLNLHQFTIKLGMSSVYTFTVHVLPLIHASLIVRAFNAPTWPTVAQTHVQSVIETVGG